MSEPLFVLIVTDEPWKEFALCKGRTSDFFIKRGQSPLPAKRLCQKCPVQEPCSEYGKQTGSEGIWGGETLDPGGTPEPVPVQIQDARPQRVVPIEEHRRRSGIVHTDQPFAARRAEG